MYDSKIIGGTLVTSSQSVKSNIYIQDGIIAKISDEDFEAEETINADGKLIFPGFIDPHVHSRDGGATYKEDFYHSTRAGALGGLTTIVEMPNAVPAITDKKRFEDQKANLLSKAYIDFAMWALCLGKLNNKELEELDELGCAAFKFFWGYAINKKTYGLVYNYDKGDPNVIPPLDDGEVYTIFEEMGKIGKPLGIHAENAGVISELLSEINPEDYPNEYEALLATRPSVCEETIIQTAVSFAKATNTHLHILHMSSKESVDILERSKKEGVNVTGETAPHYLYLTNKDFDRIGTVIKGYPPVRHKEDQDRLWEGIREGIITSMGSDHAPHTDEEKKGSIFKIPSGMCCIQTMPMLILNGVSEGKITANQAAAILSENTAKIYGMYPQKGSLEVGTDADMTIVDMNKEYTIEKSDMYSISKITAFDGFKVKGVPVETILRGKTIMKDGVLTDEEKSVGRFVKVESKNKDHMK